jgi:hypothetical protein
MGDDHVLCPDCGWTGPTTKLGDRNGDGNENGTGGDCPVCATDIEIID